MIKSEGKGRDIFFAVVALATLIVAIIGATLAYFSITASSNEGAINATAAVVSIEYNDGQQVTTQAKNLIPTDPEIMRTVYEARFAELESAETPEANICVDTEGREVCSAYRFSITSQVEREITASLNNEHNGFTYLSYSLYRVNKVGNLEPGWIELTDEGDLFLDINNCSNENNEGEKANTEDDCFKQEGLQKKYTAKGKNSIFGQTIDKESNEPVFKSEKVAAITQVYDLVLFIRERNENQNIDQGQNYRGTIVVDVLEGSAEGNITGTVDEDKL